MGRRIKINYITNCAVLIEYGTDKILVDGIFSGRQPFDIMDEETEKAIIEGSGDFAGINYVLVTHCHNDHYNGSKIMQFLEHHPGTVLVIPQNARMDEKRLAAAEASVFRMDSEAGIKSTLSFGHIQIEYMKTEHLTYKYPNHYCLNVVMEEGNVLLTADMNLDRLPLMEEFTKKEESWFFANAILLWHKKWRQQLLALGYDRICFYHLPSEERDMLGYRKKDLIHWQKHKADFKGWILLGE